MILKKKNRINIAPAKGVWGVEPHRGFESLRFRQDINKNGPIGPFLFFHPLVSGVLSFGPQIPSTITTVRSADSLLVFRLSWYSSDW